MIIIYKNKGILVPIFLTVSVITVALLSLGLEYIVGEQIKSFYNNTIIFGIGLFVSGIWTSLKSVDYIEINGVKEIYQEENSFYFIPMQIWSKIKYVCAVLVFLSGILELLD